MKQPKYSPEEALNRIKLMMSYDMGKTLNENKEIIFEQAEDKSGNLMTDNDLLGSTNKIRGWIQTVSDYGTLGLPNLFDIVGVNLPNIVGGRRNGVKGVVDALDGFVDSKDLTYVLTVLKTLEGKCYFDEVNNVKTPAINRFIELYKEDENEDLVDEINGVGTRTLPTGTDKIKQQIVKLIETLKQSTSCSSGVKDNGNEEKKPQQVRRQYVACSGTEDNPFKKLCYEKDPNGPLHKVQSCLGLTPDGKFWTKTEQALVSKTGKNSFTINDVNTICGSQEQPLPSKEDEFTTSVEIDNVDDILKM
jgi:hypothetical protein